MKRNRLIYVFMSVFIGIVSIQAQQETHKWTLQNCIDYAMEQNIQIKRTQITQEESRIDVKTAKANLFPNLSFSTGQNITHTPFLEDGTANFIQGTEGTIYNNESNSKTSYSGNYSLNAQWTLFDGKRLTTLRQQKLNTQIAGLSVTETENSVKESIAQLYIQILYATESVEINKNAVELSKVQMERGAQLLTAGSIAQSDYAQLESQYSNDKYQLISAEATLKDYKLQLKQFLEIEGEKEIEIFLPEIPEEKIMTTLPSKTEIYQTAITFRPEIQSSKLDMQTTELGIKIAKANYLPNLSLTAGISTNHSSGTDRSFTWKLKNGWRNMIGLSLSIPIFNNRQTKSAVEKARLQNIDSRLNFQNDKKNLYKTIETLWLDAQNAQERFRAATEKLKSAQTSYELVNEQFNLGMKNTVELLTEKNTLLTARQEMLQAKYMALLNIQFLYFYQGEEITL